MQIIHSKNLFIQSNPKLFIQRKYSFKWKMYYRPGLTGFEFFNGKRQNHNVMRSVTEKLKDLSWCNESEPDAWWFSPQFWLPLPLGSWCLCHISGLWLNDVGVGESGDALGHLGMLTGDVEISWGIVHWCEGLPGKCHPSHRKECVITL